ncbi:MAG TPA: glycerophosphodiester phosphodiesterase [Clostridia bacterium]|nr:glycerophosphodiester phosphodiesterase [Clostridia bacterium]
MAYKTMITAHTGALNTGRNSSKFFERMKTVSTEGIEVDIRLLGNTPYLGHTFVPLLKSKRIAFSSVLDYCKEHNFILNCDIKLRSGVKRTCEVIRSCNAENNVYLTGAVTSKHLSLLKGIPVFCNSIFYSPTCGIPSVFSLEKIKTYLDGLGHGEIKGLNISKIIATDAFLEKANALGINLSVYTVDDENTLRRLLEYGVKNITTNQPLLALELREKIQN